MKHYKLVLPVTFVLFSLILPAVAQQGKADPKAAEIAERVLDAMGGRDAWNSTRFIRFDFFGFRLHHWDRATGRHRLEGKTSTGDSYVVLHNTNTREGRAWLNGEEQAGDDLANSLNMAYSAWINDSYWLLMPYRLRDPGVTLSYDGEEAINGTTYDKLKLTFENVGLTTGDTYWAYINRDTGLMDRWAYHLQSMEADKPAAQWEWLDWADYGKIKLASRRRNVADGNERLFGRIAVLDTLDDAVFTKP